ncbi:hypothetical protein ACKVEX_00640 [Rhodocyclaceae bacterium SMB388]
MTDTPDTPSPAPRRIGCFAVSALLLFAVAASVLVTLFVARTWLFPKPFQPVTLSTTERLTLEHKLDALARTDEPGIAPADPEPGDGPLRPERYRERPEDRVIHFSQRELNAMIARNPDLADRLALHLSDDLLSATMLITLPHDLPVMAGQTVRVATGLRLRHEQGRPVVVIDGVSVMGVPLPSAWLGGLKGRDLVGLQSGGGGFWSSFGDGVRDLRIEDGQLRVELAD